MSAEESMRVAQRARMCGLCLCSISHCYALTRKRVTQTHNHLQQCWAVQVLYSTLSVLVKVLYNSCIAQHRCRPLLSGVTLYAARSYLLVQVNTTTTTTAIASSTAHACMHTYTCYKQGCKAHNYQVCVCLNPVDRTCAAGTWAHTLSRVEKRLPTGCPGTSQAMQQ
jgi:hypothetical protein